MAVELFGGGSAIWLEFNPSDLDRLVHATLSASALRMAQRMAINETINWIKRRLVSDVASATHIPKKIWQSRFREHHSKKSAFTGGESGSVWIGVDPVDPLWFGKGSPYGQGYMVKDYYFSGGFKATMKSGFESVFARTSRSRKPIEAQKITLDSEKVRE
jgi:hypothetical protein